RAAHGTDVDLANVPLAKLRPNAHAANDRHDLMRVQSNSPRPSRHLLRPAAGPLTPWLYANVHIGDDDRHGRCNDVHACARRQSDADHATRSNAWTLLRLPCSRGWWDGTDPHRPSSRDADSDRSAWRHSPSGDRPRDA